MDYLLLLGGFIVLLIGGEILVSDEEALKSSLLFTDYKTKKPFPDQGAKQFGGTRHRSAYRLCKILPNTIVFVISQDGDLRVFFSNDTDVYSFESLSAWVTQAQKW